MTQTYRIGVVSDTHGYFHPGLAGCLKGVDLILHAGDIGGGAILARLREIAPVRAIVGNVDPPPTPEIPERLELETPLGRIAMVHGHLPDAPSMDRVRMVRSFAAFGPDVVIYGHSHVPLLERVEGVSVFNPGAAGRGRFGLRPCMGLIHGPISPAGTVPGTDRPPDRAPIGDLVLEHFYLDRPAVPS